MNAIATNTTTSEINEAGSTHWVSHAAFQLIVIALAVTQAALGFALYRGWIWLSVILVLILSHFMHGVLIGFHEASHGLLRKNRLFNEFDGVLSGVFSFMSFSLYRAAHQTHHAYFATVRDEELWPFVVVDSPRWARRLAAFLELNAGIVYTPFLFLRTFLRQGSPIRSRKVRRRIWIEYGIVVVAWAAILATVAHWNLWYYFLWMYFVPAVIAGNLQSWRKYIEHVGLTGPTENSATRSIVAEGWAGKLLSLTLLHEPIHGVHHLHVGLPHTELHRYVSSLTPTVEGEIPPFPNYRSALLDLLRKLPDPRVGKHWHNAASDRP